MQIQSQQQSQSQTKPEIEKSETENRNCMDTATSKINFWKKLETEENIKNPIATPPIWKSTCRKEYKCSFRVSAYVSKVGQLIWNIDKKVLTPLSCFWNYLPQYTFKELPDQSCIICPEIKEILGIDAELKISTFEEDISSLPERIDGWYLKKVSSQTDFDCSSFESSFPEQRKDLQRYELLLKKTLIKDTSSWFGTKTSWSFISWTRHAIMICEKNTICIAKFDCAKREKILENTQIVSGVGTGEGPKKKNSSGSNNASTGGVKNLEDLRKKNFMMMELQKDKFSLKAKKQNNTPPTDTTPEITMPLDEIPLPPQPPQDVFPPEILEKELEELHLNLEGTAEEEKQIPQSIENTLSVQI